MEEKIMNPENKITQSQKRYKKIARRITPAGKVLVIR